VHIAPDVTQGSVDLLVDLLQTAIEVMCWIQLHWGKLRKRVEPHPVVADQVQAPYRKGRTARRANWVILYKRSKISKIGQ
jgi:hypothetical protein